VVILSRSNNVLTGAADPRGEGSALVRPAVAAPEAAGRTAAPDNKTAPP
jgi:hypothetical protein